MLYIFYFSFCLLCVTKDEFYEETLKTEHVNITLYYEIEYNNSNLFGKVNQLEPIRMNDKMKCDIIVAEKRNRRNVERRRKK